MQRRYLFLISGFLLIVLFLNMHGEVPSPVTAQSLPNTNDYNITLQSTSGTAGTNGKCSVTLSWSFKDDTVNPFITSQFTPVNGSAQTEEQICRLIGGCNTAGKPIVKEVGIGTNTFRLRMLNGQVHKTVSYICSAAPTPTTVPPNRTCGQICNPQHGSNACSNGLNCSSSSILIDNLIPDPVHSLGICATEDLVYQRACMDDIYDGNSTIPSCCQVIGDPPTVPAYYTRVSLNEVDELPSTYNAPKVAAYRVNTNTKVVDCVPDPEISSRKAYKCSGLTEGTDYTYKAVATGKNSNTPTITAQINGKASTSTIFDLWVTYQNKAVISPAAPTQGQAIVLTISGKKLRSPVALLTVTGASDGLGSLNQEYELASGTETFNQIINIPPLAAGTYKVKVSVAEGYKATIPASVLTYDAFSFTIAGDTNDLTITPTGGAGQCPKKSLGDANCDDSINGTDFDIWKSEFTRTKNSKDADFNADQKVALYDFEIWRKNQEVRQRDE